MAERGSEKGSEKGSDKARIEDLNPALDQLPEGRELGVVTKAELKQAAGKRVKAVLFIPEGESIESDLEIRVVGVGSPTMAAIVARRC